MGKLGKCDTLRGVFIRYVLILLFALCTLGGCIIVLFNLLLNTGLVYPANYAERKISEAYDLLQNADNVTEDMIPPLCHYAIFSSDGQTRGTDMSKQSLNIARQVLDHGTASGNFFYQIIPRTDESVVLQYSLTPQFRSAFLREHFINPQNLLTIITVLGVMTIIILSSVRFGKRMKRKMQPLIETIEKIKEQDLEYITSCSGIREFDDCLSSLDDMRTALKASLEQQWKTEQEKNRQMSALSHDIKTPLTVVRGNAELLSETELTKEQKNMIDSIINSTARIQNYVQKLIDITKSADGDQGTPEEVRTKDLLFEIQKQASELAEVYRLKIDWNEQWHSQTVTVMYDQVIRAVINIIQNAAEHTGDSGTVTVHVEETNKTLSFTVEDDGSGFTKEALIHGTEPLFMDDTGRTGEAHHGIGLYFAKTIAEQHSGRIVLTNSETTGGAKAMICFHSLIPPCALPHPLTPQSNPQRSFYSSRDPQ